MKNPRGKGSAFRTHGTLALVKNAGDDAREGRYYEPRRSKQSTSVPVLSAKTTESAEVDRVSYKPKLTGNNSNLNCFEFLDHLCRGTGNTALRLSNSMLAGEEYDGM